MPTQKIYANKDASINISYPDTNFGSDATVQCYYYPPPPTASIIHGLIGFDLTGKPQNIISATLNLYRTGGGADQVWFAKMTRDFDENTVTWNEAAAGHPWTDPGGDTELFPFASNNEQSTGWVSVDVPINLLTGNQLNILLRVSETGTVAWLGRYISKDDFADINKPNQPYLEIQYDADVAVTEITVDKQQAQLNQPVKVTTKVFNSTNFVRQVNIVTTVDGSTQIDNFQVSINANETYTREVTTTFTTIGVHNICSRADQSIDKCTSVDIQETPNISITNVTTNPLTIAPDTQFDIVITLKNNSPTVGSFALQVSVDGNVISTSTETVGGNAVITKRVSQKVSEGRHTLCANTVCIDITAGTQGTDYSKYYVPVALTVSAGIVIYYAYMNVVTKKRTIAGV